MWKERLVRIFFLVLALLLIFGGVRVLAGRLEEETQPHFSLGEKIKDLAVKNFSEPFNLEKILGERKEAERTSQESEPISQPVKKIEEQTQTLLESIKKLPADQLEALKKQIYKEFCQNFLE